MQNSTVSISVRNLVEFILQSGDLVSSFSGTSRTTDAIKAHQKLQASGGEDYEAEVTIDTTVLSGDIEIKINGRIDGVIKRIDGIIIDEIKTTLRPISEVRDDNVLHWAQAKCYAYMYAKQNSLSNMGVQLTYYNLDTKEIVKFNKEFEYEELKQFFYSLADSYAKWAKMLNDWAKIRDESIKNTSFPYNYYRKGQREMAVMAYRTIRDGGSMFVQAPTGTGKTIASLFPAVKALGEGNISKIFYLTAKNTTGALAESAVNNMRTKGLKLKTLSLCAKEKICFQEEAVCDPEKCEYAKGHFDRIRAALEDIFQEDSFNKDNVQKYAQKHKVCPFEFSLDLSLWADCVICDYNYVFDPRVYLKRFFMETGGDYTFLIDEAHNLVDRSREMFSSEIIKEEFLNLKKEVKASSKEIYNASEKINKYFIEKRKELEEAEEKFSVDKEAPQELYPLLRKFNNASEKWLVKNIETPFRKQLLEQYFKVMAFLRTAEYYDERYVTYFEKIKNDIRVKLYCLDSSFLLSECLKRGKTAVFFSATLTPLEYFSQMLGGDEKSKTLKLSSPFPRDNLCLMINDAISTRYSSREASYDSVTSAIKETVCSQKGNYLVFFPSYKYMEVIYERFQVEFPDVNTICQTSGMKDEEREEFLAHFSEDNVSTLVGFAVMGGIFGEGIDLTEDKLCGAIIIGVGLPQICLERDIIRDYFQKKNSNGFEYAYVYPGMNKVMQAVGRVIRTETDRGIIMLIDERFSQQTYRKLFPEEWLPVTRVRNKKEINCSLKSFWSRLT